MAGFKSIALSDYRNKSIRELPEAQAYSIFITVFGGF